MKIFAFLIVVPIVFAIIGCANMGTVNTNLDQTNFTHYFSPNTVKIFPQESAFNAYSILLGAVEGEACQIKPHHAFPDIIEARTQARRNAFKLGANAIVFSGCVDIKTTQACHATVVCYAKAYYIKSKIN